MKDAAEIRVSGTGGVYAAPVGTTVPSTPTGSLDAAFVELGYTTEDGVTFSVAPTVEDINAWQSADPVRRLVTARILTVTFSLEQLNQENFIVAFGGGSWSQPSAGIYRYTPPGPTDALQELCLVIRAQDGQIHDQYEVYRCNITETVETSLTRSGAQLLPVTAAALTPAGGGTSWGFLSDDDTGFGLLS